MIPRWSTRLARSLGVVAVFAGCDTLRQPLAPDYRSTANSGSGSTPSAPSNPNATAVTYSQINVSWLDNSSNESGFEIYRSISGPTGTFSLLARVGANVTGYSDGSLAPATSFCYRIRAFRTTRSATNYSALSDAACATTLPPPPPPAPPTDLTAEAVIWKVVLMWLPPAGDYDGFVVERCTGLVCADTDFLAIATTDKVTQSYGDYWAASGETYTYRVRAFNAGGNSAPSNTASATACYTILDYDSTYYCSSTPP